MKFCEWALSVLHSIERLWQIWNESSAESHAISHGNWDYTNRESSEYFMGFTIIHITTRLTHIPVQKIILYRYDYMTLKINSFSTKMCICTKRISRLSLCSNFFTSGHRIIFMLSAKIHQVCFRISTWSSTVRDIVMCPYLLNH